MALGSWTGLYTSVIENLMAQRKDKELLMLLAIQRHCDPFGFCFPGRARLFKVRHCSKDNQLKYESWLEQSGCIRVTETFNPRHRQFEPDYQVSPRVLYVRPEVQDYCQSVFDGQPRDFAYESAFLVTLSSTKESQTEESESETRIRKPESGIQLHKQHHDQRAASTKAEQGQSPRRILSLHESTAKAGQQRIAQSQPTAVQNRKAESAGLDCDEFHLLLDPGIDDDRIVQEIQHVVSTSEKQARQAVEECPRDILVHWLRITAVRRAKGELIKPGGFFFRMIKTNLPLVALEPGNPDSVVPVSKRSS